MRGWFGTLTALPMSWQSDGDHDLVVGAGALGERGRLQAVRELVDGEAVGDVVEATAACASTRSATRPRFAWSRRR